VVGADGQIRAPNGRDFRFMEQLGHARIDTTSIYAQLANPERRAMGDRVQW